MKILMNILTILFLLLIFTGVYFENGILLILAFIVLCIGLMSDTIYEMFFN